MYAADYNVTRLATYVVFFDDLIAGRQQEQIAANLLTDVRCVEIARAFATSLPRACSAGIVRPLADDVGAILEKCARDAFGTSAHARLPSWFLQNYEAFLASSTHKLLRHYAHHPATATTMAEAFGALLQVAEGMKRFVGLEKVHSGAHALLAACEHSRVNFLATESSDICASHLAFVEVLGAAVLREPERSVRNRHNALSFFAKSARWQQFAAACSPWLSRSSSLANLNGEIRMGIARADRSAPDIASLASAFLAASPPPPQPRRAGACTRTPIKRPIGRKRSAPFVELVRKLVES